MTTDDTSGEEQQQDAGETRVRIRVQLRALDLDDLDAIQPLFMQLNTELAKSDPLIQLAGEPAFLAWMCKRARHQQMLDQNYIAAVAEREDGVILGYCAAHIELSGQLLAHPQHGVISELFIAPEMRGVGLGSKLLQYITTGLAQKGIRHVRIAVPPEAAEDEGFFAQHGFRKASVDMICDLSKGSE